MKIIKNKFDGLIIFQPTIHEDARGEFCETWREKDYKESGIKEAFVQDNISISHKNVLRGLHYQKGQGQLVTVLEGKIFDVVVDIRKKSQTYQKYFSLELDGVSKKQIYMPPGFTHGFYVLSEVAVVLYKCTAYYNPLYEEGVNWNDPVLNIQWPNGEKIISKKDSSFKGIQ